MLSEYIPPCSLSLPCRPVGKGGCPHKDNAFAIVGDFLELWMLDSKPCRGVALKVSRPC